MKCVENSKRYIWNGIDLTGFFTDTDKKRDARSVMIIEIPTDSFDCFMVGQFGLQYVDGTEYVSPSDMMAHLSESDGRDVTYFIFFDRFLPNGFRDTRITGIDDARSLARYIRRESPTQEVLNRFYMYVRVNY